MSGFYHFLKRSVYGKRADRVMGTLFCFKWFRTEILNGEIQAAGGKAQGGPKLLSEDRETLAQGALFFLYEKIQSGHIVRKKICPNECLHFFFSLHLRVSELQWSGAVYTERRAHPACVSEHPRAGRVISATLNTFSLRLLQAGDTAGPRIPHWRTGRHVTYHVQVKCVWSLIHMRVTSLSFRKPKGSIGGDEEGQDVGSSRF